MLTLIYIVGSQKKTVRILRVLKFSAKNHKVEVYGIDDKGKRVTIHKPAVK